MRNPPRKRRRGHRAGRAAALALAALLLSGFLAVPLFAQEGDDFDSLFDEEIIEEAPEGSAGGPGPGSAPEPPEEVFLLSEKLEWGGRFSASSTAEWSWYGFPSSWEDFVSTDRAFLDTRIEGDLFFDARPERDFRVFGKLKSSYRSALPGTWEWDLEVFELFSDFQLGDRVFFRMGKHTIRWGVGYFFSPADVLNLVSIDPEDPEAEREGPVSLKAQVPFGPHNAYLYVVANDVTDPAYIAAAPKLEIVIGRYELGIGGFYQTGAAPKGMLTLTGSLWELDLFGEGVLQWGSDRTYVRAAALPPFYETYRREDELLFSATAGASYLNADWKVALYAQYYYNGLGYEEFPVDAAIAAAARFAGDLTASDLLYRGQHYLAGSVSWSEILDSDFSLAVFSLTNFSDGSGQVGPTVSWQPWDYFRISFALGWVYGDPGDELAPNGTAFGISLGATLGSGRF